jgi:cytochrome c-type biogenesis protein CcmH
MSRWTARFPVIPAMVLVLLGFMGSGVCRGTTQGVDANGQLEDRALQSRFERIASELRCLQCQNETIADSNAELAVDLRQQVREMLISGKSDDAIFDFMTNRYGEFVRFKPPLEFKTAFIWGAPFFMLLLGGVIIYRIVRHRSGMPVDDESAAGPGTN